MNRNSRFWHLGIVILASFALGALIVGSFNDQNYERGSPLIPSNLSFKDFLDGQSQERLSPSDHISENQIFVYSDKVVIYLKNPQWARFTDTNSMDPVIDVGANAIEIVPSNESEIHVGDIISYESTYASGTFIHRVIKEGKDDNGWFAIVKGDNNPSEDPGKIRFKQIKRMLVGIIY